jgi:hypothetical protein
VRLCGIVGNNSNFFLNYLSLSSPSQKKLEPSSSLEVSTRDYVLDAEHIAAAADTMRPDTQLRPLDQKEAPDYGTFFFILCFCRSGSGLRRV